MAHYPTYSFSNLIHIIKVDSKCSANVFSAGKTEVASYYNIWEAVTAVFAVCVRVGKIGGVREIGMYLTKKNRSK